MKILYLSIIIICALIGISSLGMSSAIFENNTGIPPIFPPPPLPPYPNTTNLTMHYSPTFPELQVLIYQSPLMQFKKGTPVNEIKCNYGLQLFVKAEDGFPACVKPETAQKLLSRGWVRNPSIQEILKGPENENTTLQIAGTIFYYLTLNDTMTGSKGNGIQTTFHNVLFTFLPSPWHSAPLGECAGFAFGSSAKFTDGTLELLRVDVPETGCLKNYIQSDMTNHTTPQAGLIVFSDGKIRLLVSVNNLVHPVPGQHPKDADAWLATHPHFVSCLVWNLKTQLAKEVPCAGH